MNKTYDFYKIFEVHQINEIKTYSIFFGGKVDYDYNFFLKTYPKFLNVIYKRGVLFINIIKYFDNIEVDMIFNKLEHLNILRGVMLFII